MDVDNNHEHMYESTLSTVDMEQSKSVSLRRNAESLYLVPAPLSSDGSISMVDNSTERNSSQLATDSISTLSGSASAAVSSIDDSAPNSERGHKMHDYLPVSQGDYLNPGRNDTSFNLSNEMSSPCPSRGFEHMSSSPLSQSTSMTSFQLDPPTSYNPHSSSQEVDLPQTARGPFKQNTLGGNAGRRKEELRRQAAIRRAKEVEEREKFLSQVPEGWEERCKLLEASRLAKEAKEAKEHEKLRPRINEILKDIQEIKEKHSVDIMEEARAIQEFVALNLTKFTLFPKLPIEIRRYIWKAACFFPRIIELERQGNLCTKIVISPNQDAEFHGGIRVAAKSQYTVPALFLVCRESQQEAKRFYKLTRLEKKGYDEADRFPPISQEDLARVIRSQCMWFNPLADIVYFGENSCLGTMWSLIRNDVKVARVAIDVGVIRAINSDCCKCCDREAKQVDLLGPYVDHLIRQLRVLHGLPILAKNGAKIFPGYGDLKEVFLLMREAGPLDHEIKDWDICVGFEKYSAERPYFPRVGSSRLSIDGYVQHLLASAKTPLAKSTWKGQQKPTLHVARLSKPVPPHLVFEILAINFPGIGQHRMIWWITRDIYTKHRCMCTFYPLMYSGPGVYSFKFMGEASEVAAAMQTVAKEIARCEGFFKQKLAIVDPRKAVFRTSDLSSFVPLENKLEAQWRAIGCD